MNMTPTQSMQNMYARRRMSHEHAQRKYRVRYSDNRGVDDCVVSYNSEEEAEAFIKDDLQNHKDEWANEEYDYGYFGSTTEIWIAGSDQYARWERLWK